MIEQWASSDWPALKRQARKEGRTLVFADGSGFYLLPGRVRTYSIEGLTPVIDEWQTCDHLSVMGGVILNGRIYTLVRQKALVGEDTLAFLEHLGRAIGGPTLVVWDGSPIHRRKLVGEFVETVGADNLRVVALPSYAPDLKPVEWLWRYLKLEEMRNLTCLDLEELHEELHLALGRIRRKPLRGSNKTSVSPCFLCLIQGFVRASNGLCVLCRREIGIMICLLQCATLSRTSNNNIFSWPTGKVGFCTNLIEIWYP